MDNSMEEANENASEMPIYQNQEGNVQLDVNLDGETVWLNQAQMAKLFGKARNTITEHIGHIFDEGELEQQQVCRDFRHTTAHGAIKGKTQQQTVKYYNLDVIISVGYRVKSQQYKQEQKQIEQEMSLKEIEEDIKRLGKQ